MNEVRLIDANALIKIIEREIYYAENPTIHRTLNYCLGVINNAPTVDVGIEIAQEREKLYEESKKLYILAKTLGKDERPHGEWKEVKPHQSDLEDGIDYREECSICHEPNRHYGFDEYHDIKFATYYKTNF